MILKGGNSISDTLLVLLNSALVREELLPPPWSDRNLPCAAYCSPGLQVIPVSSSASMVLAFSVMRLSLSQCDAKAIQPVGTQNKLFNHATGHLPVSLSDYKGRGRGFDMGSITAPDRSLKHP